MTAIDNWSALQIEGDMFTFIAREGKSGSCNGKPCGFVLKVDPESGEVEQTEIPSKNRNCWHHSQPGLKMHPDPWSHF